jgi:hypothetical protein
MRPIKLTILFLVLATLVFPAPAHAWFGWLDNLSGPGPFHSKQVELRLVCFGEKSPIPDLSRQLRVARARTGAMKEVIHRREIPEPSEIESVIAAWRDLRASMKAFASSSIFGLDLAKLPTGMNVSPLLFGGDGETLKSWQENKWTEAEDYLKELDRVITPAKMEQDSIGSVGVLWSLCSDAKVRRLSIEMGVNFYESSRNPSEWADGKTVTFTTYMPAISWRPISDPRYDIVDLAVGGGGYVFTSAAFPSFTGVVLQPYRLDLHFPSGWSRFLSGPSSRKTIGGLATLVSYRYGYLLFPKGFGPNVFAGPTQQTPGLPAELVRTRVLFLNLEPLAQRMLR